MTTPRPSQQDDRGLGLVNLGWLPWGTYWKRNQSMVHELTGTPLFDRTVFVNPRGLWIGPQLLARGSGSVRERVRRISGALPRSHGDAIRVLTHWHFIPFKRLVPGAGALECRLFLRSVHSHLSGRPYVLLNNHPGFEVPALRDRLMDGAVLRVFDLSDDFVEYYRIEEHREQCRRNLADACAGSDLVLAVNEHVAEKYSVYNPNVVLVPNSTNFHNFHRERYEPVPALDAIAPPDTPLFGCTGIINRIRVDYGLVEHLAEQRPDWQFAFVGSADQSFVELTTRHANLHHFPPVAYDDLPNWIHRFDAAIIPFHMNDHTAGNDLLKFHDYLAMGKAVVTSNMGGAWRYEGLVHVADDDHAFLEALGAALRPAGDDVVARRIEVARRNSWSFRARQIEGILRKHLEGATPC